MIARIKESWPVCLLFLGIIVAAIVEEYFSDKIIIKSIVQCGGFIPLGISYLKMKRKEKTFVALQKEVFKNQREVLISHLLDTKMVVNDLKLGDVNIRVFLVKSYFDVKVLLIGNEVVGGHSYRMSNWGPVSFDLKNGDDNIIKKAYNDRKVIIAQGEGCVGITDDDKNNCFENTKFMIAVPYGVKYVVCFDAERKILLDGYDEETIMDKFKRGAIAFLTMYRNIKKRRGMDEEKEL